ncbi:MAG: hypothetical protein RR330_01240 [Alistipes sp.]
MKRCTLLLFALFTVLGVAAQNGDEKRYEIPPTQQKYKGLEIPDSLLSLHWEPTAEQVAQFNLRPAVTMSSIFVVPTKHLPHRVSVLPNNVLRLVRHVTISNGQAANYSPSSWGTYPSPGAFRDARTLSMPMRRR